MKREIKFRAWDKKNKGFINGFNMFGFSTGQGSPTRFLQRFNSEWQIDEVELMQYAGLKDKNGKEIYEGDIITISTYGYEEPENDYTGQVVYGYAGFCLLGEDCNARKIDYIPLHELQGSYTSFIEVIGNIYENPNLLQEEK